MQLALDTCLVRSFEAHDAWSLARHANNRRVWLNLRDYFPHPYTVDDARTFIESARTRRPETEFAIAIDGLAVGAIGFVLQHDVERVSAQIGYWIGEELWGRGVMTDAVKAVTAYAIARHGLTRLYAAVFEWNLASARVLEKAGYQFEARLRRSAIKDSRIIDQLQYAFIAARP